MITITPEYVLQLFRGGNDTWKIAKPFNVHESAVAKMLSDIKDHKANVQRRSA